MAKPPFPFAPGRGAGGKRMPKKGKPFEKSKKDVEPKGMKEGSPAEEALDAKQAGMPMFARGGLTSVREREEGFACGGKIKKYAAGGSVQKGGMSQRGWGAARPGKK